MTAKLKKIIIIKKKKKRRNSTGARKGDREELGRLGKIPSAGEKKDGKETLSTVNQQPKPCSPEYLGFEFIPCAR